MLTLLEAKIYLRVDTSEEDNLIKVLIATSEELCKDVLRTDELVDTPLIRSAMLYAVAYLFEHREEANHHDLKETLYNLLGGLRK